LEFINFLAPFLWHNCVLSNIGYNGWDKIKRLPSVSME